MLMPKDLLNLFLIIGFVWLSGVLGQSRREYYAKKANLEKKTFDLSQARNGGLTYTNLDDSNNMLLVVKRFFQQQTRRTLDELYELNRKRGKLQKVVDSSIPFPCNTSGGRSPEPPTSVHRLRPGDIDVIADVGDSISAGNNILSDGGAYMMTEFRGMSFSGGGDSDWRHYLTLPNIIKEYNPNLYGYAENFPLAVDKDSRFNLAEPMMVSEDMIYQVEVLIDRLREDPKVDMQKHWKLITILVGANDICSDICHYENKTVKLQRHEQNLRRALQILRDNVPRLMVHVLSTPDIIETAYRMTKPSLICFLLHNLFCNCIFNVGYSQKYMAQMHSLIRRWKAIDEKVTSLPEFHDRDDFTVNYQPILYNSVLWTLPNGDTDYRYFSDDCFHFSQLGHATLANGLWNDMLQPTNATGILRKPPFEEFLCPSDEQPYLYTRQHTTRK